MGLNRHKSDSLSKTHLSESQHYLLKQSKYRLTFFHKLYIGKGETKMHLTESLGYMNRPGIWTHVLADAGRPAGEFMHLYQSSDLSVSASAQPLQLMELYQASNYVSRY